MSGDAGRIAAGVATMGLSEVFYYQPQGQIKATKAAAAQAAAQQEKLLKAAEEKSLAEDATNASAISRARQKALAASVAAQGRASTIASGSQGVTGQAPGTTKSLIGE